MWLVDVSIKRPVFATMMIGSLVIMSLDALMLPTALRGID